VNYKLKYVDVALMHIDAGVDTDEIIHQFRARVHAGGGPHLIDN
jgi:hypothetical protein